MHLLAFILMFMIGAFGAASKGDYSGTVFLGKIFMGIGLFFIFGCIITGFSTDGSGTICITAIVLGIIGFFMAAKEE